MEKTPAEEARDVLTGLIATSERAAWRAPAGGGSANPSRAGAAP